MLAKHRACIQLAVDTIETWGVCAGLPKAHLQPLAVLRPRRGLHIQVAARRRGRRICVQPEPTLVESRVDLRPQHQHQGRDASPCKRGTRFHGPGVVSGLKAVQHSGLGPRIHGCMSSDRDTKRENGAGAAKEAAGRWGQGGIAVLSRVQGWLPHLSNQSEAPSRSMCSAVAQLRPLRSAVPWLQRPPQLLLQCWCPQELP